eukprot:6653294-Prymnesium_polylepis.1
MMVRPAVEDGPSDLGTVKGNKEQLDAFATTELDFGPWVSAQSETDKISDDVNERKRILLSGYIRMLVRIMMRKKKNM